MRLGLLSTADINRKVIPGAHASDKIELIAVASREQRRAEEYAREWGIERAYGSYEALLEDADVFAVYISLPNTMHCDWSVKAVEAGKHVLCRVPRAPSTELLRLMAPREAIASAKVSRAAGRGCHRSVHLLFASSANY